MGDGKSNGPREECQWMANRAVLAPTGSWLLLKVRSSSHAGGLPTGEPLASLTMAALTHTR